MIDVDVECVCQHRSYPATFACARDRVPGTREATPGPESETREVKLIFSFVASNYFYFS